MAGAPASFRFIMSGSESQDMACASLPRPAGSRWTADEVDSPSMADVDRLVRERARALGFDRVGVASASEPIEPDFARYQAFIEAGKHGKVEYLARPPDARKRLDTSAILEGAQSVICVAESYAGTDAQAEGGIVRHVARYARGGDYHNHLRRRVRKLAAFVRTLGEGTRARPMSDDAPVLERAWASRAGQGFIGKNGLVIAPGAGSFTWPFLPMKPSPARDAHARSRTGASSLIGRALVPSPSVRTKAASLRTRRRKWL